MPCPASASCITANRLPHATKEKKFPWMKTGNKKKFWLWKRRDEGTHCNSPTKFEEFPCFLISPPGLGKSVSRGMGAATASLTAATTGMESVPVHSSYQNHWSFHTRFTSWGMSKLGGKAYKSIVGHGWRLSLALKENQRVRCAFPCTTNRPTPTLLLKTWETWSRCRFLMRTLSQHDVYPNAQLLVHECTLPWESK